MSYGPEVSPEERNRNGTVYERGLHVVCYQSSIVRGFKFIQQSELSVSLFWMCNFPYVLLILRMVQQP